MELKSKPDQDAVEKLLAEIDGVLRANNLEETYPLTVRWGLLYERVPKLLTIVKRQRKGLTKVSEQPDNPGGDFMDVKNAAWDAIDDCERIAKGHP